MRRVEFLVIGGLIAALGCRSGAGWRPLSSITRETPAAVAAKGEETASPEKTRNVTPKTRKIRQASETEPEAESQEAGSAVVPAQAQETAITAAESGPLQGVNLTLRQAIETGLAQNPDLIALRQQEGVSAAILGVAQTYPFNPFLQVQVTPYQRNQQGGTGGTYHYVLFMQTLQLAHQQSYREQAGAAQLNSARWLVHQAELVNLSLTERLFFTALYQRGIRDLLRATAELNTQLLQTTERRAEAQQATAADVAIIRLDARSTGQQAVLAEANYQTALLDLRRQLNIPTNVPLDLQGDLTDWHWRAATPDTLTIGNAAQTNGSQVLYPDNRSMDGAIANLAEGRPDVMAARSDLDVARANCNLAVASQTPDLQIGPYYQRDDFGTYYLGLRAHTDIPIWNNGAPLANQRRAELRQRQTAWTQLRTRATIEAEAAIDRYERARKMAQQFEQVPTNEFPAELQRLEEQAEEGLVDVLRVFTARTSLIQVRRTYLDSLNELALAASAVTAATGLPPESLVEPATEFSVPTAPSAPGSAQEVPQ